MKSMPRYLIAQLSIPVMLCGVALFAAGCAHSTVADGKVHPAKEPAGSLKVYTPQVWRSVNERICYVHSDYRVLTGNGRFYKDVANAGPLGFSEPDTVSIPAGAYRIVAQEPGHSRIVIPVSIKAGETTILQLDGNRIAAGGSRD